ncbi:MAG: isomerase [Circular genetic element sp.]|nr:MAG: isomerase [Circular genetic element sp.]
MTCLVSDVFCDWLDVTCSPESSFIADLRLFCDVNLWPVAYADHERILIAVGHGKLVLDIKKRYHRASASGSVLALLRTTGLLKPFLALLGRVPHRVTRLDAAVDVAVDGPVVLRTLEARYPMDRVSLSRKSLGVVRMYSARESDGQLTGTWYVGHRSSARVTARVYDKQAEILSRTGLDSPPLTRYELTFKKDLGCTLRDCLMPASLFYEYASGKLLAPPRAIPAWVPNKDSDWSSVPVDLALPYEVFCQRVERSPEIARLVELAAEFGPVGRPVLIRAFTRALDEQMGLLLEADTTA